ncbi:hypothetical protein GCM10009639_58180 [Kitasatospora putterlickiae]|uniref:Uncharacterized protein n=1 Tax=Kitasatospora putterlickiae TaxID=221725 RepID=A0ABN1YGV7_9ACTN
MSSPCDPSYARAGDVATAVMVMDSRLKAIYDGKGGSDPEQRRMADDFARSMTAADADALLDGVCTLIYMYMDWLRTVCERHDKEVIEHVVPTLVATMRMMPNTFRPEVIPTMAGLLIASGTGLSPNLWRAQYGDWTRAEMNPLEATAVILAEHINRMVGDDQEFATRLITDALAATDEA